MWNPIKAGNGQNNNRWQKLTNDLVRFAVNGASLLSAATTAPANAPVSVIPINVVISRKLRLLPNCKPVCKTSNIKMVTPRAICTMRHALKLPMRKNRQRLRNDITKPTSVNPNRLKPVTCFQKLSSQIEATVNCCTDEFGGKAGKSVIKAAITKPITDNVATVRLPGTLTLACSISSSSNWATSGLHDPQTLDAPGTLHHRK